MMLLYKLKAWECAIEKEIDSDKNTLKVIASLKQLLLKIDYEYETLPEYSLEKIIRVLEEVKKGKLTSRQKLLLEQMMLHGD
ncbi:hypothetical protein [Aestuariibaculum sediminum]|uniref:Uncharacterized protein n=1 Tax=Aestuariibaculum sediminum TaxID=2770637 RepID=A0A8J6PY14_9FLAO|nr:hypothetical protein [Aestuariibaculum sediminum]MBD0830887.1 hypothetical protein [Aestuariibaculum sediminum]